MASMDVLDGLALFGRCGECALLTSRDTLLANKDGRGKEPELPVLTPRDATFPKLNDPLPITGGEADLPDQPVQKLGDLWIRCGDLDMANSTLRRGSITAAAPRLNRALPDVPRETPPPASDPGAADLGVPELPPASPYSGRSSPLPPLPDEFGGGPVNAEVLSLTNVRPGEVVQEVLSASRAGTPAPPTVSSRSNQSSFQTYHSLPQSNDGPYLLASNHLGASSLSLSHVPPRSPSPPSSAAYDGATVEDEDAESVKLAYDGVGDESVEILAYDRERTIEAPSPSKRGMDGPPPLPPKSPPRKQRPLSVVQSRVKALHGPRTPEGKVTPLPRSEPPATRREPLRESVVQMFEAAPAADEPQKRTHRSSAMAERIRAWQPNPREASPPLTRVDSPHISDSVLSFDPNDLNPSRSASQVRRGDSVIADEDEPLGALGIVTRRVAAVEAEAEPAAPAAALAVPSPVAGPRRPRDLRQVVEANLGGPRKTASLDLDKSADRELTKPLLSEPVSKPALVAVSEPLTTSPDLSEPATSSPNLSDAPNVTRPLSFVKAKTVDTETKPLAPIKTKSVDTLSIPVTTPVSESIFLRREREAAEAAAATTDAFKIRDGLRPITPKPKVEKTKSVDSLVAARAALLPVSPAGTAPLNIRSRSPAPPRSPDTRSAVSSTTPRTMGARALAAAAIFEPGIVDRVTSPSVASSAQLATPLTVPSPRPESPAVVAEPAPIVSRALVGSESKSTPLAKSAVPAADSPSTPSTPSRRKPVPALIAAFETSEPAPPTPAKSATPSVRSFRPDMPGGLWGASPASKPRSIRPESVAESWETTVGTATRRGSIMSTETLNPNAPVMDSVLAGILTPTVENGEIRSLDDHLPVPEVEDRQAPFIAGTDPKVLAHLDAQTAEHAEISHQLESVHIDVTKVAEGVAKLPPDLAQRMDLINTDVKGVQAAVESSRAEITALLAAKASTDKDLPPPPPTEAVEPQLPEVNAKLDAIAHLIQEVLSRQADLAKETTALTAAAAAGGAVAGGAVSRAVSDDGAKAKSAEPEAGIPSHAKPAMEKMTDSTIPKPDEPADKDGAASDVGVSDAVKELQEHTEKQTEQTADIARCKCRRRPLANLVDLHELNNWLETFVSKSSTSLESMSKRLNGLLTEPTPDGVGAGGLIPEMHDMLADQAQRGTQIDEQTARLESLVGMMTAERERAAANQGIVESVVAVVEKQRADNEMLLRALATDLTTEIRGERLHFIEAMQQATTMNMQIHVDEFKRSLSGEVAKSMNELGKMREQRKALEHQIADLFALKAKHNGDTVGGAAGHS